MRLLLLLLAVAAQLAGGIGSGGDDSVQVSLGDSYSSGEGAGSYYQESDRPENRCHRSRRAWPRLLGAPTVHLLACSGAETKQLYAGAPKGDEEGQLVALERIAARGPVDLVTITIGGNDIGFAAHVRNCFVLISLCLRNQEKLDRDLRELEDRLVRAYEAIDAASGEARIVVVGYPEIVPRREERDICLLIDQGEKERAALVATKLNRTVADAAATAGVEFVSVHDALDGHELCTAESWMQEVRPRFRTQEMGHPTADGHRAIAAAVRAAL
jgi:lysophospholipase L1-like esterase